MTRRFFYFSSFEDEIQDFTSNFWIGLNQSFGKTSVVSTGTVMIICCRASVVAWKLSERSKLAKALVIKKTY
jgi:hypothetical protein